MDTYRLATGKINDSDINEDGKIDSDEFALYMVYQIDSAIHSQKKSGYEM